MVKQKPFSQLNKRLVLFFDGTWNKKKTSTNVFKLYLMLADLGEDGILQKKFYDEGVGTHWYDRVSGGIFGVGVFENIRQGYLWLMEHYNSGDEIFIFGFSRGAFTARSLAGIISRCGLLKPNAPISFWQVCKRYQKGDKVKNMDELKNLQKKNSSYPFDFEEKVLLHYTYHQPDLIKMIGVWDTVGSVGLPFGTISNRWIRFHNTNLNKVAQHSYQALALDEFRKPYWGILWTHLFPEKSRSTNDHQIDNRMVEQRWFAGAHTNVGGGYPPNTLLPQRPLMWLQKKACACGLNFRCLVEENDEDLQMPLYDSYGGFLYGFWKLISRPYVRWVMSDPVYKKSHWRGNSRVDAGWIKTANERIDLSVFQRCQLHPSYRPPSLLEWAHRKKLNLEAIIAEPNQSPELWQPVTKTGIESFSRELF